MCFKSKVQGNIQVVPKYKLYSTSGEWLGGKLQRLSINPTHLWDGEYFYHSGPDWQKIINDVLLNMPKYTTDKFDCDNFSMLTCSRVIEKYQVNGMGIAIGSSPMGYHAFNIFLAYSAEDEAELFMLEPQTGVIMELNTEGYHIDSVIWG